MGYEDLANLTHYMENVLDGIRNEKIKVTSKELDAVFFAVDHFWKQWSSQLHQVETVSVMLQDAIHMLMQIEKGSEPIQTAAQSETAGNIPRKNVYTN